MIGSRGIERQPEQQPGAGKRPAGKHHLGQPEAAGDIRGGMVLAAALIEGATFFALIVCIIAIFS